MKHEIFNSIRSATLILTLVATAACSSGGGSNSASPAAPSAPEASTNLKTTAPNALPENRDQAPPSLDRQTMNTVLARAQAENKSVILEVSAAWCGPCTQFAYDLETHPESLAKLTELGYILVKGESEKAPRLDINDFLPSFVKFFPSFYLYTPGQGWKAIGPTNSVDELTKTLIATGKQPSLTAADFKALFDGEAQTPGGLPAGASDARINATMYGLSSMYSYDDAKDILNTMRAVDVRFPNHSYADMADQLSGMFMADYLAVGAVTFETLARDFPEVALDITDASRDSFQNRVLQNKMSFVYRNSGAKAAAAQCETAWKEIRSRIVPGTLSAEDFQKKIASTETAAVVLCTDLDVRVNGASDAAKQRIASLDQTEVKNWKLLADLGNIDGAVATYHARYVAYDADYVSELATGDVELQKAVAANDTAKVEELTKQIAIVKFQQAHHLDVDTIVENALKASTEIEVLHVLN